MGIGVDLQSTRPMPPVAPLGGDEQYRLEEKAAKPFDETIPPADVEAIAAAHPDLPLYLYDAGHAFVAPGAGHHADSARLAMLRTLKHFQRSGGARGEV
jgi:hypothetical protein